MRHDKRPIRWPLRKVTCVLLLAGTPSIYYTHPHTHNNTSTEKMQKGQVPVYECSETKELYIGIGLVIIPEYIGTGLVMTLSEIDWHRVGNDTK